MINHKKIPFNIPPYTGDEDQFVISAMRSDKLSGDGVFSHKCHTWFEEFLPCKKALLTPSATHALELTALLIDIKPGDEVIMPSYTFVSTANAFALRGAKIIFVDIRPDTMNIDESKIELAITKKTKAIVVVHYAGVACEMNLIMKIANKYNLYVIEDAAQAINSKYHGKQLGTIGHLSAFSFHETKNISSGGEGGLLAINDSQFIKRAEILREKGTNRSQFFRGEIDKYSWVDIGSSYLPSEIQAAYLWGQLKNINLITENRLKIWEIYHAQLKSLAEKSLISLPITPNNCQHNGHMFYLKTNDIEKRTALLNHLKSQNIHAVFHYVPLHTSIAGKKYSSFFGKDIYTTQESEKLIRLPMFYGLKTNAIHRITNEIHNFFHQQA